jgi:hypothetical protein
MQNEISSNPKFSKKHFLLVFVATEVIIRVSLMIFGFNIFWNDYQSYSKTQLFGLLDTAIFWSIPSLIYSIFSLLIITFLNLKFDKTKLKFLFIFELILLTPTYFLLGDDFTYKNGVYDLIYDRNQTLVTFAVFGFIGIINILYLLNLKMNKQQVKT